MRFHLADDVSEVLAVALEEVAASPVPVAA